MFDCNWFCKPISFAIHLIDYAVIAMWQMMDLNNTFAIDFIRVNNVNHYSPTFKRRKFYLAYRIYNINQNHYGHFSTLYFHCSTSLNIYLLLISRKINNLIIFSFLSSHPLLKRFYYDFFSAPSLHTIQTIFLEWHKGFQEQFFLLLTATM